MKAGNNQLDPGKRIRKNNKSSIIERIRKDINRFDSIEWRRQHYKGDDFSFYRACLIFTVATNKALCAAIGIPVADGRKYAKALGRGLYKIELVHCPFSGRKEWTTTTDPRKAHYLKLGIPVPHSTPK